MTKANWKTNITETLKLQSDKENMQNPFDLVTETS